MSPPRFPAPRSHPRRLALPALLLLAGCASTPPPEQAPADRAAEREAEPVELNLNLPPPQAGCDCPPDAGSDRTFLERGVAMLAEGEYIEAVQYFQRYQRLEKQPLAQWESQLAIAYVSMLPNSPFYDAEAARRSYRALQATVPEGRAHASVVLMRQALDTFLALERDIDDLENRALMLRRDLDKREQALRRLRELTLGQPAGGR